MLARKRISMLERAQETSIKEFAESYTNETISIDVPMDRLGSILVPIDIESNEAIDALTKFRYHTNEFDGKGGEGVASVSANALINNVSSQMVEIPNYMSFKDALNVIYNTYKTLGDRFYGAFLVNKKNQKFNPLHPISALELMADSAWANDTYKVYLYMYNEEHDSYQNSSFKRYGRVDDTRLIEANIANQISLYKNKKSLVQNVSGDGNANDLISSFRRGSSVAMAVENRMTMDETCKSKRPALMIPHNIINNGITAPYYGTSIVSMNNTQGHNIAPMMSANISLDYGNFLNKSTYGSYGVCTGQLSSSTLTGLRSLNHANLLSPMNSSCLQPGWMDYVEKCIDYAFMVYEPILEGFEQRFEETYLEPTFETYMEQWMYEHPESTTLDYIKHVAEKNKELINVNLQEESSTPSNTQAAPSPGAIEQEPAPSQFIPF